MKVEKIYHSKLHNQAEVVYQLSNGTKIIKRNQESIKKLNVEQWEEISFISENFEEVPRDITVEEEAQLKSFLARRAQTKQHLKQDKSLWDKLRSYWKSIIKRFQK